MLDFSEPIEIAPGAVWIPAWLNLERQRALITACREWAKPPAGMKEVRMPGGAAMSVRQVCLGWHWYPYRYSRTIDDGDGAPVKPLPDWLAQLGQQAVDGAYREGGEEYRPDIAIVNYYDHDAKMGLHQDKDEQSAAPVVSLSLGESCVFRLGNTENRNRPWRDVELASGDLFVFGAESRMAYHGVTRTLPGTAPAGLDLADCRLNITLRESGFQLVPQGNTGAIAPGS